MPFRSRSLWRNSSMNKLRGWVAGPVAYGMLGGLGPWGYRHWMIFRLCLSLFLFLFFAAFFSFTFTHLFLLLPFWGSKNKKKKLVQEEMMHRTAAVSEKHPQQSLTIYNVVLPLHTLQTPIGRKKVNDNVRSGTVKYAMLKTRRYI